MTLIQQDDFIESISNALQFISYYHPKDFIQAMYEAYLREQNSAAKDAMAQILINSNLCAQGKRPICQDTGIVTVFIKIGMGVQWQTTLSLADMVNEGVRRAYQHVDNPLRASILSDPAGMRINTGDNTPAVIHTEFVLGEKVEVAIAAKGGGSEAKAKFVMLNPSDDIVNWVIKTVPTMGAGWCPPGILGIGIGGTAEKAMLLAKLACMEKIDIQELLKNGAKNAKDELRLTLYDKINGLGIGAQGLGGLTTVLDVKILDYPTHAANLPIAIIPNCAATRHLHFVLDGSGVAEFEPPKSSDYPVISETESSKVRHVHLDTLTAEDIATWRCGEALSLTGTLLTARDAAHKRLVDILERGESLPEGVDLKNKLIYSFNNGFQKRYFI